jgi:hypothetical protein
MHRRDLLAIVALLALTVAASGAALAVDPPKAQADVINALQTAISAYDVAKTPAEKSAIAAKVKKEVDALLKDGMKGWVATPVAIEATNAGDYWVQLDVGPSTMASTYADPARDAKTQTLLPKNSPLLAVLKELKPGQQVTFDGAFLGYNNMSEEGRVGAPNLLTRFTSFKALPPPPPLPLR